MLLWPSSLYTEYLGGYKDMLKSKILFALIFLSTVFLLPGEEKLESPENSVISIDINKLPEIESLKPARKNILFSEYQSIIESNNRIIKAGKTPEYMFFKYKNTEGFTFQGLAARCCISQDTLATLNKIESSHDNITGKTLILPTVNGLFITKGNGNNSLEQLLHENYRNQTLTKNTLYYNISGIDYLFLQDKKFTPTERAYFLDSSLCLPLDLGTYWVSSEFGQRKNPLSGKIKNHNGIDLAAPLGTPVYAVKEGAAYCCIYDDPEFGNYIILTHDAGKMTSVYAHLSEICVEQYESVKKGQLIGYVGQTGMATGPHLHFEIRKGGVPVNPRKNLRLGD